MRGLAGELEMHVRHRQRPVQHLGTGVGMNHHRGVDLLENASADQPDLSPAAFFRRRPNDQHAAGHALEQVGQRNPRPGRGGADQVVPAAVSETAERVIFRQEGDRGPAAVSPGGHKGRRGVRDTNLDREPVFLEQLGEPGHRLALFIRNLRVRVDVAPNLLQLGPERIEPSADLILQLADRRLRNRHAGQ